MRSLHWVGRVGRVVGAATVLLVGVVGVPWLLVRFGSPAPRHAPTLSMLRSLASRTMSDTAVFAVLTVAAWLAWCAFAVSVLVEVAAVCRGVATPRLPGAGVFQRGVGHLVAVLFLAFTTSRALPAFATPAGATTARATNSSMISLSTGTEAELPTFVAAAPARARTTTPPPSLSPVAPSTGPATSPGSAGPSTGAGSEVVTVQSGDSAWQIAEDRLHDGMRWREIWELNAQRVQSDGSMWTDPELLLPGWQLELPPDVPSPASTVQSAGASAWYTVVAGDTLEDIASRELGDSAAAEPLFALNEGRLQGDGGRLSDPNLILPGWRLQLPDHSPTPSPAVISAPSPVHSPAPSSVLPAGGVSSPVTAGAGSSPTPTSTLGAASRTTAHAQVGQHTSMASSHAPVHDARSKGAAGGGGAVLPARVVELAGISGATVLATSVSLLLLRLRRRRSVRGARLMRRHGQAEHVGLSSDGTASVVSAVRDAADIPMVSWAAQELSTLASVVASTGSTGSSSVPMVVELSPTHGIEVLWDVPPPCAAGVPSGWSSIGDGYAWRRPYDADADAVDPEVGAVAVPGLVTIGQRGDGVQLLVDLEAFGAVAVLGDPVRARSFIQSLLVELATGDTLSNAVVSTVGIDCADAKVADARVTGVNERQAVELLNATAATVTAALKNTGVSSSFAFRGRLEADSLPLETQVVIARCDEPMDARALVDAVTPGRGVGVVIVGPGADVCEAPARLVLDADGSAILEPLGVVFHAVALPDATAAQLIALVDAEATIDAHSALDDSADEDRLATAAELTREDAMAAAPFVFDVGSANSGQLHFANDSAERATGPDLSSVDPPDLLERVGLLVRVLGAPSLPDRPMLNRRETQLAVFLACKDRPVSTTSVQDALWNGQAIAAKTVWNLVTRTRTKLGGLPDGRAVMPPADRVHNTLQLAPSVHTDLALLGCAYAQALDSSTVDAIGLLRAGLALVEGPPFDAAGYDWAHHGEQWVTDASVLIEGAALLLVELGCGAGDMDVARFAVSCGLRGLPGNEPLYRARMRLEHQAGNLAAVHGAYRELVGFLEELELEPSSSTERLYRELCGATEARLS